jgi:hypothetical protein
MLEDKLTDVKRKVGLAEPEPARSRWLWPMAALAGVGAFLALIVNRLRGRGTTDEKPAAKPKPASRSRTNSTRNATAKSSTGGSRRTSGTARTTGTRRSSKSAKDKDSTTATGS